MLAKNNDDLVRYLSVVDIAFPPSRKLNLVGPIKSYESRPGHHVRCKRFCKTNYLSNLVFLTVFDLRVLATKKGGAFSKNFRRECMSIISFVEGN